ADSDVVQRLVGGIAQCGYLATEAPELSTGRGLERDRTLGRRRADKLLERLEQLEVARRRQPGEERLPRGLPLARQPSEQRASGFAVVLRQLLEFAPHVFRHDVE